MAAASLARSAVMCALALAALAAAAAASDPAGGTLVAVSNWTAANCRGFGALVWVDGTLVAAAADGNGTVYALAGGGSASSPLRELARGAIDPSESVWFGFALLGTAYLFTGTSTVWLVDAATSHALGRANLSAAIGPGWMGSGFVSAGASLRSSEAYLTGDNEIVRFVFDAGGVPSAAGRAPVSPPRVPIYVAPGRRGEILTAGTSANHSDGWLYSMSTGDGFAQTGAVELGGRYGWPFALASGGPGNATATVFSSAGAAAVDTDSWTVGGAVSSGACEWSELGCFDRARGVGFLACGSQWQMWSFGAGAPRLAATLDGWAVAGGSHSCAVAGGPAAPLVYLAFPAAGGRGDIVAARYEAPA